MAAHLGRPLHTHEHVHHRDGDSHNNDLSNLELLTVSEHRRHHARPINVGEANQNAKLTRTQVDEIRASTLTQQELAGLYGVSRTAISKVKRGIRW